MARRPRVNLAKFSPLRLGRSKKARRIAVAAAVLALIATWVIVNPASYETVVTLVENNSAAQSSADSVDNADNAAEAISVTPENPDAPLAIDVLEKLEVKGRAPKTGYTREEYYKSWPTVDGCNLRQKIIKREFGDSAVLDGCDVISANSTTPTPANISLSPTKPPSAKASKSTTWSLFPTPGKKAPNTCPPKPATPWPPTP